MATNDDRDLPPPREEEGIRERIKEHVPDIVKLWICRGKRRRLAPTTSPAPTSPGAPAVSLGPPCSAGCGGKAF